MVKASPLKEEQFHFEVISSPTVAAEVSCADLNGSTCVYSFSNTSPVVDFAAKQLHLASDESTCHQTCRQDNELGLATQRRCPRRKSSCRRVSIGDPSASEVVTLNWVYMCTGGLNEANFPPLIRYAHRYNRRMEKVRFGVPMSQVCKRGSIPAPLLIMLLKLNKEGPYRKDIFRAPGHHTQMARLVEFVQQGRLVNIEHFSVTTVASVVKKFLRKLPNGLFGDDNEAELIDAVLDWQYGGPGCEGDELDEADLRRIDRFHNVISSLPSSAQQLLVLLIGTFRLIHTYTTSGRVEEHQPPSQHQLPDANVAGDERSTVEAVGDRLTLPSTARPRPGMTAEALAVSVTPSFFHSCAASTKEAKMEDVVRLKQAAHVVTFMIHHFGNRRLFDKPCYEFYARITGRLMHEDRLDVVYFTFPPLACASQSSLAADGVKFPDQPCQTEVNRVRVDDVKTSDEPTLSLFLSPISPDASHVRSSDDEVLTYIDDSSQSERELESLTPLLPEVHEKQTRRMQHRSEWFLATDRERAALECPLQGKVGRLKELFDLPVPPELADHVGKQSDKENIVHLRSPESTPELDCNSTRPLARRKSSCGDARSTFSPSSRREVLNRRQTVAVSFLPLHTLPSSAGNVPGWSTNSTKRRRPASLKISSSTLSPWTPILRLHSVARPARVQYRTQSLRQTQHRQRSPSLELDDSSAGREADKVETKPKVVVLRKHNSYSPDGHSQVDPSSPVVWTSASDMQHLRSLTRSLPRF